MRDHSKGGRDKIYRPYPPIGIFQKYICKWNNLPQMCGLKMNATRMLTLVAWGLISPSSITQDVLQTFMVMTDPQDLLEMYQLCLLQRCTMIQLVGGHLLLL